MVADLNWTNENLSMAQKIVMERFAMNAVTGHLTSPSMVGDSETTVKRNRFDFAQTLVVDREVFGLYEPFSYCLLSKAQVVEFNIMHDKSLMHGESLMQNDSLMQTKAITTFTRAASRLARWHDVLFFRGFADGESGSLNLKPPLIEMPPVDNPPQSLREAAIQAEQEERSNPVWVDNPLNEG